MAFAKGWDKETDITFGKDWDAEKMLRLYIYNYMKKKGLHDVADIFAKEANLELFEVLDSDYGFLKEWWELFWPQFCSRLANKAGGNSQSSAQPSMQDALALLSSLKNQGATGSQQTPIGNPQHNVIPTPVTNQRMIASGGSSVVNVMGQPQGATGSQQTPIGDPQHNVIPTPVTNQRMIASGGSSVVNVMGQRPVSLLQTPPGVSRRKAGKRPLNTDTARILGKLSTQAIRKGPLGFPPVKLLPTQLPFDVNQMPYTTPPPSGNPSNLHLPVTMQSPVEVTGDPRNDVAERSDQMESNRLGRNSAYPPPGLHADEFNLVKFFEECVIDE